MVTVDQLKDLQLKTQFDEHGFVVVREFLDADNLAQLSGELDRYIRDVVPSLPKEKAFFQDRSQPETLKQMQNMEVDAFFDEYRHHPLWTAVAEALLGEPVEVDALEWFNKPPGTDHVTPPHQDNYYFCFKPPQVVTLWLALDPVDEKNGCLRYVAGSHHHPLRDHAQTDVLGFSQSVTDYGEEDRQKEVTMILQPGDLAAHHGNLLHRADANRSDHRQRRSFALVFHAASCEKDAEALDRYMSQLSEQHHRVDSDPPPPEK